MKLLICVVIIILGLYLKNYYTFVYLRSQIFPFHIDDLVFDCHQDHFIESHLQRLAHRSATPHELEFLVKYKKFCDSPHTYSMASRACVDFAHFLIKETLDVPGDIAEFGVWKGGMAMWIQSLLMYYNQHHSKKLFLFDAFTHFPSTDKSIKDSLIHPITHYLFENTFSLDTVISNFYKFNLNHNNLVFVPGLFQQTCPHVGIQKLSILRIDCDYYEPTLHVLNSHYFHIQKGGYIVIDDFNNEHVSCREAVLEFRQKNNITIPIQICHNFAYWQID